LKGQDENYIPKDGSARVNHGVPPAQHTIPHGRGEQVCFTFTLPRLKRQAAIGAFIPVDGTCSETSLQSWEYVDATAFPVRGVNYLKDKVKVPSQPCAFELVEISGFSTEGKVCRVLSPTDMPPPALPPRGISHRGPLEEGMAPYCAVLLLSEALRIVYMARQSATTTTTTTRTTKPHPMGRPIAGEFRRYLRTCTDGHSQGQQQQQVLSPEAPVSAAIATAQPHGIASVLSTGIGWEPAASSP
jgi:hypothetical protein